MPPTPPYAPALAPMHDTARHACAALCLAVPICSHALRPWPCRQDGAGWLWGRGGQGGAGLRTRWPRWVYVYRPPPQTGQGYDILPYAFPRFWEIHFEILHSDVIRGHGLLSPLVWRAWARGEGVAPPQPFSTIFNVL